MLSCVWLFATPWTVAQQTPLSRNSPEKNTEVGSHSLLQGSFLTHGSNLGLLHCRQILYHLSHHQRPIQILKAAREKRQIPFKERPLYTENRFFKRSNRNRRQCNNIFKVMIENNCQPKILYPKVKVFFKNERRFLTNKS